MTLTTKIAIHQQIDWRDLHGWVNDNLLKPADWGDKPVSVYGGDRSSSNDLGQGLNSLYSSQWAEPDSRWVWFDRAEEAASTGDYYEKYPDELDSTEVYYASYPDCAGYIDFDTPYGYSGPMGEGAWTQHAYFIQRLALEYFAPRGITFHWQDEGTGEWHEGLSGFAEMFKSGDAASSWFQAVAAPAIQAHISATSPNTREENNRG